VGIDPAIGYFVANARLLPVRAPNARKESH
jgi:hypothetical protein